jgi:hypothetical protein
MTHEKDLPLCGASSERPRLGLISAYRAARQIFIQSCLPRWRSWSLRSVTLPELVAVAGARWSRTASPRHETGLDQYQVRKYRAWYRHVTLSMLAHAFLAVCRRPRCPAAATRTPSCQRERQQRDA